MGIQLKAAEQARNVALQMMAERGRGLVLVGAARLDLALEHLLKAVMAPNAKPDDKLFTPDRPLGSLGAKIFSGLPPGADRSTDRTGAQCHPQCAQRLRSQCR